MDTQDWKALIEHWQDLGHDLCYLDIPPGVAAELGIDLPLMSETKMTGSEDSGEQKNAMLTWKRQRFFDGEFCGISKCKRKADGYVMDIKPTKGGAQGQLWYGPACKPCLKEGGFTDIPLSLAELAHQRNGASDLALILDVEVGEVLKRLEAAGIDDKGQPRAVQTTIAPTAGSAPAAAIPQMQRDGVVASEAVAIPTDTLALSLHESNEFLPYLETFHIHNQGQMDIAAQFLAEAKSKWNAIDTLRKDIGAPLRGKLQEIQDYFRPALDALRQVETVLKTKIAEGNARAQEAQRAALAAAQAAHAQGDTQAVGLATQAAARADVALPGGVSQRPIVRFEIVDPSQLPGNFWSPDPAKIQQAINAGYREIPGVRIWEDTIISSRASS